MGHMATYFVELSRKNDFRSIAQQPDVILTVRTLDKSLVTLVTFARTSQHLTLLFLGQLLVGAASRSC